MYLRGRRNVGRYEETDGEDNRQKNGSQFGDKMSERLFEELLLDPQYLDQYIGIRVEIKDGRSNGVIVALGRDPDEVHAEIRRDLHNRPVDTRYYFCKPTTDGDTRQGWAIGGEE